MNSIRELLAGNPYPGRGIVLGRTPSGQYGMAAYFIMGRSGNSRNRIFAETEDGIRTEAFDPSKMEDPSLIIYAPVRMLDERTMIVTNGDQTDTIVEYMREGKSFGAALRTRSFEPDAPNYTPRISGLLQTEEGELRCRLSILKSNDGDPAQCCRYFYHYDNMPAGEGRFLSTYEHDGDPLPSFTGEPRRVAVSEDPDAFAKEVWDALDAENRVSLFVRRVSIADGSFETRIINKNE